MNRPRLDRPALPLADRSIVVTRPQDRAGELVAAIGALGGRPLRCPLLEVRALPIKERHLRLLGDLQHFEWLIFTSASAGEAFYGLLKENGGASLPASLRVIAVGKKTAAAVRDLGWPVDIIAEQTSAEGVVATLLQHGAGNKTNVLFPRALEGREVIPQELERIGARTVVVPVYQTVPVIPDNFELLRAQLLEKKIDAITFTSPSAVHQCFRLLPMEQWPVLREICLAAIGPTTAAAIVEHGLRASAIPKAASAVEMIKAIANYFTAERAPLVRAT